MSTMPCDLCNQTVNGKLFGFYLTLIYDGVRYKRRMKVCQRDVDQLVSTYGSHWSDGFILNRMFEGATCASCNMEHSVGQRFHPMYCTCYSASGHRFDYYASYCEGCAVAFKDTFVLEAVA